MNAIDLLAKQHQEVRDLFEELEDVEDNDDKQACFEELADDLAAHSVIEEKLFYPAAYAAKTEEMLNEAVEEHLSMKRIIADLMDLLPDDEEFDAKIKVLKEQVEHHVEEEENEIFAAARLELDDDQLEALGAQMEDLYEQEIVGAPSESIRDQTDQAARVRPPSVRPARPRA
jgi:hypothetical protein